MARIQELPPDLQVAAFRNALEELGFKEGTVLVGEDWSDRVMMGMNVKDDRVVKSWTNMGRAARLWKVHKGGGRGYKTKVILLANRRMGVGGSAQEEPETPDQTPAAI